MHSRRSFFRSSVRLLVTLGLVALIGCENGLSPDDLTDDDELPDVSGIWLGVYDEGNGNGRRALVLDLEQSDSSITGTSNEGTISGSIEDDHLVFEVSSENQPTERVSDDLVVETTFGENEIAGVVTDEDNGTGWSFTARRHGENHAIEANGLWQSDESDISIALYADATFVRTGGALDGTFGVFLVSGEIAVGGDADSRVVAFDLTEAVDGPAWDAAVLEMEEMFLQADDSSLALEHDVPDTFSVNTYGDFAEAMRKAGLSQSPVTITVESDIVFPDDVEGLTYRGSADLRLEGNGSDPILIDAGGHTRILYSSVTEAQLTIDTLELSGGHAAHENESAPGYAGLGGAVLTAGPLVVENSVFSRNSADSHGGAVHASAAVHIVESEFSDNTAVGTDGGAIRAAGDVSVSSSLFVGNTAVNNGGAIGAFGGDVSIAESQFEENAAKWNGAVYVQGNVDIDSSEFIDNVGELRTSAFADFPYEPDGDGGWQPMESRPHNLTTRSTTYVGTDARALGASGNLIAGDDDNDFSDHEFFGWGDFDTFEFDVPIEREYEVADYDELAHAFGSPDGPVEERIVINITQDIDFDESISYWGNIDIHLIGNPDDEPNRPVLDANNQSRFFEGHSDEAALLLDGLTITQGDSSGESNERGGAIRTRGSVTVMNSTASHNSAPNRGGFVYAGGKATFINSLFSSNHTDINGGVGQVTGARIENSTFEENSALDGPGVLFSMSDGDAWEPGNVTIVDSHFANNEGYRVGGVYAQGEIEITDSVFENNRFTREGSGHGAVLADKAYDEDGTPLVEFDLILSGVTFTGNDEPAYGAAGEVVYDND